MHRGEFRSTFQKKGNKQRKKRDNAYISAIWERKPILLPLLPSTQEQKIPLPQFVFFSEYAPGTFSRISYLYKILIPGGAGNVDQLLVHKHRLGLDPVHKYSTVY